jgi:general secretion pathway protein L
MSGDLKALIATPSLQQIQSGMAIAAIALGRVATFWLQEFRLLLPEGLGRWLGRSGNRTLTITLDDDRLRVQSGNSGLTAAMELNGSQTPAEALTQLLAGLKDTSADKASIHLLLPERLFFTRNIQLPAAALGNLPAIVRRDMEARTPFRAGDVLSTHTIASQAQDIITVTQTIFKTAILQRELDKAGLSRDRLLAVTSLSADCMGVTIPVRSESPPLSPSLKRTLLALWTSGAVLLLGGLWTDYASRSATIAELEQKTQGLRAKAANVRRALDELAAENAATEDLRRRKWQMPNQRDIVEELTRILPPTAWLTELRISEKDMAISGYASGAADLIPAFRNSSLFAGAALSAPIVIDPVENRERFSIAVQPRPRETTQANSTKPAGSPP